MQASHKWMTLYFRCSGHKNVFSANPTVGWSSTLGGWSEPSPWNFRSSTSVDFLGKLSIFFPRVRIIMEQQHFLVSSAGHGWVSVGWRDSLSPQLDSLSSSTAGFLWLMMADGWRWLLFPVLSDVITFYQSQLMVRILKPTCCQLMVNPLGATLIAARPAAPIQWLCHTGVNSY